MKNTPGASTFYRTRETERQLGIGDEISSVRDRDILTLQTCVGPDYGERLIVRADRLTATGL